jgi:DNA-binding GntR family transcriptional regulator
MPCPRSVSPASINTIWSAAPCTTSCAQEYGVEVRRARQSLEPLAAGDYEAEMLGVLPGAPLMLERRLSFDAGERPVEHGRDLYRGDRFRFVTETAPWET